MALKSFRTLTLVAAGAEHLGAPADLPHLTELTLDRARLTGADPRAPAAAPALHRLVPRDTVRLDTPLPAHLREALV